MSKLYIAYGSNLNIEQMSQRCPTARIYGSGYLNNWQLIFRGSKTGAYATICRKKGYRVPVVLWTIEKADERRLDTYEGYPTFYGKESIMATLQQGKKKAMVYIMDPSRTVGRPSQYYIDVVHEGYVDNDLDTEILDEAIDFNEAELKKASRFH